MSCSSYDVPEPVDVADLSLDGRAAVVVLHGGWDEVGVYLSTPRARARSRTSSPPVAGH